MAILIKAELEDVIAQMRVIQADARARLRHVLQLVEVA
jgi:hypothetical protein